MVCRCITEKIRGGSRVGYLNLYDGVKDLFGVTMKGLVVHGRGNVCKAVGLKIRHQLAFVSNTNHMLVGFDQSPDGSGKLRRKILQVSRKADFG